MRQENWEELMKNSHSADEAGLTVSKLPGLYKESADIIKQLQQYNTRFKMTVLQEIAEYYGLNIGLVDKEKLESRGR